MKAVILVTAKSINALELRINEALGCDGVLRDTRVVDIRIIPDGTGTKPRYIGEIIYDW